MKAKRERPRRERERMERRFALSLSQTHHSAVRWSPGLVYSYAYFVFCYCLPFLPGFACSIHTTWGPTFSRALYILTSSEGSSVRSAVVAAAIADDPLLGDPLHPAALLVHHFMLGALALVVAPVYIIVDVTLTAASPKKFLRDTVLYL